MIELNLLPKELRKQRKKIELPDLPLIPISAAIIGALIVVQLILGFLIMISNRQLISAEKTWKELAPKKAEFDKIKKEIALTTQKTNAIEGLIESRFNWARFLNELSNSLTANIWLTELSYNEQKAVVQSSSKKKRKSKNAVSKNDSEQSVLNFLVISGSASGKDEEGTAYIARFIKSLKNNQDFFSNFDDIELVSIKKGTVSGKDVMNFTISCKFKPGNTSE
jgi:Tfp pilus assembly protein PilN